MKEYTVFWRDSAEPGMLYSGGLAVGHENVWLQGSDGRRPATHRDVPGEEIAAVRPASDAETIAGFPSARLELRGGRSLVVAAVMGALALSELVDAIASTFLGS